MGWNFNRYFQILNNAQVCPLFSLLHITWRKPSYMTKMIIFCFILCILYINASDLHPRMLELVTRRLIHVSVNCLILCAQLNYQLTGAPQPSWRSQCWRGRCTTTSVWPGQALAGYLRHRHALSDKNRGRPQLRPLWPGWSYHEYVHLLFSWKYKTLVFLQSDLWTLDLCSGDKLNKTILRWSLVAGKFK